MRSHLNRLLLSINKVQYHWTWLNYEIKSKSHLIYLTLPKLWVFSNSSIFSRIRSYYLTISFLSASPLFTIRDFERFIISTNSTKEWDVLAITSAFILKVDVARIYLVFLFNSSAQFWNLFISYSILMVWRREGRDAAFSLSQAYKQLLNSPLSVMILFSASSSWSYCSSIRSSFSSSKASKSCFSWVSICISPLKSEPYSFF